MTGLAEVRSLSNFLRVGERGVNVRSVVDIGVVVSSWILEVVECVAFGGWCFEYYYL